MRNHKFATIFLAALAWYLLPQPALAEPISYSINYFLAGPISSTELPTSAGFTYDPVAGIFTDFHVQWLGVDLDLTGAANSPIVDPVNPGCSDPVAATSFRLLSGDCGGSFWHGDGTQFLMTVVHAPYPEIYVNLTGPNFTSRGRWTISENTVPEPSTAGMIMLAALALGGAKLARRIGRRSERRV